MGVTTTTSYKVSGMILQEWVKWATGWTNASNGCFNPWLTYLPWNTDWWFDRDPYCWVVFHPLCTTNNQGFGALLVFGALPGGVVLHGRRSSRWVGGVSHLQNHESWGETVVVWHSSRSIMITIMASFWRRKHPPNSNCQWPLLIHVPHNSAFSCD